MTADFKTYLEKTNFNRQLELLNKKLKNKKVVLYGAGSLFQYIKENYNLSKLNIIGISDKKFSKINANKIFFEYQIIPFEELANCNADYILVATQDYIEIIEDFACNLFYKKKIKIKPLVKMSLLSLIKKIWSR